MEKNIFDLSGKVALVTGGGSGFGRVFCKALAEFGADIACCDINEKSAGETIELVKPFGHRTFVIKADVSQPDEVQHMVDETIKNLGTIDILFNNAGISTVPTKVHEMPLEDWDRVMAVNLRGNFLCTRAVLPAMLNQKRGVIINIASVAGLKATHPEIFPHANYSASKAGVIGLTRQTAIEYARYGIRVNCIAPGFHEGTALSAGWGEKWTKERQAKFDQMMARGRPMGRSGQAEDMKGLAVYLASDASGFVTGQVFVQDGGQAL